MLPGRKNQSLISGGAQKKNGPEYGPVSTVFNLVPAGYPRRRSINTLPSASSTRLAGSGVGVSFSVKSVNGAS